MSVTKQLCAHAGFNVVKKPKSKSSIRVVRIPHTVRQALRKHRAIQMREGLAGCRLLFPTKTGKHLQRTNFHADEWKIRLARCGIPHREFHNTRHTFATLSLLNGCAPPVVSRALGHCSPTITMGTYSHVLPSVEGDAAAVMERLLA
jgi:integrase